MIGFHLGRIEPEETPPLGYPLTPEMIKFLFQCFIRALNKQRSPSSSKLAFQNYKNLDKGHGRVRI